jgi:uncharacterized protein YkwD
LATAATQPARIWLVAAALACALTIAAADAPPAESGLCPNAGTPSSQLSQREARQAVRCLINEARTGRNLRLHRKLNGPALKHSRKMREHTCLQHVCPGEPPTLAQRLRKYLRGGRKTRISEVIAVNGASTPPREIVSQWLNSTPHRVLVLGRFKHLGVGVAVGGGYAWYTVDLGSKR